MNRITNPAPAPDDALLRACHGVLLPVVGDFEVPAWLRALLAGGTSAVLLGETRAEYVAREMSPERRAGETGTEIARYVAELTRLARGSLLVAVDQEPWGIRRLHDLVPGYPEPADLLRTPLPEIGEIARAVAEAARELGVSMFLSPVLDVLEGENPWLEGRTLQPPAAHAVVGTVAAAFVAGTQSGGVAAVAKHFPGFPRVPEDPALAVGAVVPAGHWDRRALRPFDEVVRAGAAAVMLGPAIVEDLDEAQPASTSRVVVETLRQELGFTGLVVSDDLDAPATLLGRSLTSTMIDSLRAGADLLLVGGGEHLLESVQAIHAAAREDELFARQVHAAAGRVRGTARSFTPGSGQELVDAATAPEELRG